MKIITLTLTLLYMVSNYVAAQDWKARYDEVGLFENGLAYVMKENEYGYVDKNGKEVIPCIYNAIGSFNPQGLVWVNKGGHVSEQSSGIVDGFFGIYDSYGQEYWNLCTIQQNKDNTIEKAIEYSKGDFKIRDVNFAYKDYWVVHLYGENKKRRNDLSILRLHSKDDESEHTDVTDESPELF